jgi:hypothetical protein
MQKEKAKPKKSWDNITLEDYNKLEPGFFLNGALLDFGWNGLPETSQKKLCYLYVQHKDLQKDAGIGLWQKSD